MSQDLFRVELGVEVEDGPSFLVSTGVPGNDVYSNAALIGSWCTDSSTGDIYKKHTAGTGDDKWELIISQTELDAAVGSQVWRDPVEVLDSTSYANLAAAQVAVNTGSIDGVTVVDGDRLLFTDITGQPANVFIVTGTPGAGATLVEDPKKSVAEGDVLSVKGGTYAKQQVYFDGTDWISTGSDASAELSYIRDFIGKSGPGAETPTYSSTVYASGNLETAIGTLDAAIDSNDTDITNIQNANTTIQTEIDNIEVSIGDAINTDGTFAGYSGTSYIDTATSLTNADELLDDAISGVQTEADAIETSLGAMVTTAGVYVPFSGTNYIDGNASVTEDFIDLDTAIATVDANNVSRHGDTMEPGANIVFSSGGEVTGLPSTPSGPTAATSKDYVDSLSSGLVWIEPTWYIDLTTDEFGGAVTKDLQTPANNTDPYLDSIEDEDIIIVASGTNVTWTAVGAGGNSGTTAGLNAGDVVRWNSDAAGGGQNPSWVLVGHISENATFGSGEVNGIGVAKTRWGLDVSTSKVPGGTFAGFDNAIVSLAVADFDGDASTTEYDALWAICGCFGTKEQNTVSTVAAASLAAADFFDLYSSTYGPNITGSTVIDSTNTVDGGTKFYVWYDTTGSDTDPAPSGYAEGIKVDVSALTTDAEVAQATVDAINGYRPQQGGDLAGQSILWTASIGGNANDVLIEDNFTARATAASDGANTTGFTFARTTIGAHAIPDDASAFFVANPDDPKFGTQWTYAEGNWTLFGGSSAIVPGIGLSQSGSVLNVNLGAGITELPSDEVGVDVRPSNGLWTTNDGLTSSTLAGAQLGIKLDGTTLTMGAAGLRVSTAFQTEIDAIETSLGAMVTTAGVYVPFSGTDYIDGNASVTEDLTDLDAAIKANETLIGTTNSNVTDLQTEVDAIETSFGAMVAMDGTYVAHTGTNYIDGNASVTEDLTDLDAAIKTNADDIVTINANNGDEGFIRDFIGKGAAGAEDPAYSSTNVVTQGTDLETAIGELDEYTSNLSVQAESLGVTAYTTLDSVAVDDVKVVKWIVHAQQGDKVTAVEVLATHDGQLAVDATDADHSTYAKLKLNGNIPGLKLDVTVSGTGTGQVINLRVKANSATDFSSVRRVLV